MQIGTQEFAILSIIGLCVVLYLLMAFVAFPTKSLQWRMTIEIETPQGVKSGSGVMATTRIDGRWVPFVPGPKVRYEFTGQAIHIDLSEGKNIFALVTTGAESGNSYYGWMEALPCHVLKIRCDAGWPNFVGGPAERVRLTPPFIPVLVSFDDFRDPTTVRLIYATSQPKGPAKIQANNFSTVLGPGYALKAAWLETLPSGTATSDGIAQLLPWLRGPLPWEVKDNGSWIDTRRSPSNAYKLSKYQLIGRAQ